MSNQTHTALPHLPKGMNMPHVKVEEQPAMPGLKSLPAVEWKDGNTNQVVPQADPGSQKVVQRRTSMRQGLPVTERKSTLGPDIEPPPMFSAQPNKISTVLYTREPKAQKQVYRMDSGIDPVTLLSSRLECWRLAIKNLVGVFKKIVEAEESASKSWIGAGKTINVPFKESHGQFLQSGGIQDVWSAIRDYSNEHGILHHSFANYLRDALIPALRGVKEDIKKMVISVQGDKQLKSTEIFNSRLKVDRNIARLDKSIQAVDRAPHMAHQTMDPFLANLSVIHSIRELCDHENRLHDHALQLQQETGMFELKVIESLRYIMKNLQDFRLQNKMEYIDTIGMIQSTFDNIQPATEWNDFIQRNQNNLVMENSAYKTESSVEYPNQNHRYVRASKIGQLLTKTGVTRNMTEGVFILTPTGYLHGYKTPQYFQSNPLEPSFSIFMPNTTVTMDENDPEAFTVRTNKNGKMAAVKLEKSYQFLAHNPEEAKDWFGVLSASSTQYQVTHLIDTSRPTFSAVQQNRNLPPLPASTLPLLENEKSNDHQESSSQAHVQNNGSLNTENNSGIVPTTHQIEGSYNNDNVTENSPNQDSYQSTSYGSNSEPTSSQGIGYSSYPDGNVDLYSAPEEMDQKQPTVGPTTPLKDQSAQGGPTSTNAIQNPIFTGPNNEENASSQNTTANQNTTDIQNAAHAQSTSGIQNDVTSAQNTTDIQSAPNVQNTSLAEEQAYIANKQNDSNALNSSELQSNTNNNQNVSGALDSSATQGDRSTVQDIQSNIQNKSAIDTDDYADPTLSSEKFTQPTAESQPSVDHTIQQQTSQSSSHQAYNANLKQQHDPSTTPYRGEDELQYRDPPTHIDPNNATHVA